MLMPSDIMLSVTIKSIMLNVIMLSVVKQNVIRVNVVASLFLSVLVFAIEDKPSLMKSIQQLKRFCLFSKVFVKFCNHGCHPLINVYREIG